MTAAGHNGSTLRSRKTTVSVGSDTAVLSLGRMVERFAAPFPPSFQLPIRDRDHSLFTGLVRPGIMQVGLQASG